ncbi:hypothetical protein BG004_001359 [Podila humilis]|nr:hypothetical protein BG004_001359 [Podila humilis]
MTEISQSALDYQRSTMYKLAASPYPEWSMSALCAASLPSAARSAPSMPHLGVMMGFSAVFATAGYMKYMKDAENGSGTTTSWCLLYLFLNLRRTISQPKPLPSLLIAGAITNLAISGRKTVQYKFGV